MKNRNRRGTLKPYSNDSGSDISSGEVVGPFGTANLFGVAVANIADGDDGTIDTGGEYTLDATSADAWDDGDTLYWDEANSKLTDSANAGANKEIGHAVGAKLATETEANVQVNSRPSVG